MKSGHRVLGAACTYIIKCSISLVATQSIYEREELIILFNIINSWTPKLFQQEQKTPARKAFGYLNTRTQTSPPWWSHFPLQQHGFDGQAYTTPGSLFERGWTRPLSKGFCIINKLKEKIIYFYSLSVNYNNRSPAVSNDSQKGIHCCRQVTIIYELT